MADDSLPLFGFGRRLKVRQPSSAVLEIPPGGSKDFHFEPWDRDVLELEIRARIIGGGFTLGHVPRVRLTWSIGHGKSVWTEPPPNMPIIIGSPTVPFTLPARGLCTRIATRELHVTIANEGPLAGAPAAIRVELSAQPVLCSQRPTLIRELGAFPVAGRIQPYPCEASEFRLCDVVGLPLAAAAVAITPVGIFGALLGVADGAGYADWRPIPHDAIGYVASAAHYAQFR
jgi:hypothetical protein